MVQAELVRFITREGGISAQNARGVQKLREGAVYKYSKFDHVGGLVSLWSQLSFSAQLLKGNDN